LLVYRGDRRSDSTIDADENRGSVAS
jgi:hypothetical protein